MARRNLTIQLDEKIIRKAKIIAAERGTSVSGLVTKEIEGLVSDAERYEAARARAIHFLETPPFRLGGKRPTREDLHERKRIRR